MRDVSACGLLVGGSVRSGGQSRGRGGEAINEYCALNISSVSFGRGRGGRGERGRRAGYFDRPL